MLDERTSQLLNVINEKCAEGSYKVFEIDELIESFPTKYVADGDLIRQMITALSTGGYVCVKFDRDDEFCLSPTPKGREYFETSKKTSTIKCSKISRFFPYLYNFITMTLGVFFGVLLAKLFGIC